MFSNELARRYSNQGIVSTSLNPGNLSTDLQRTLPKFFKAFLDAFVLYPSEMGALTQLWAGTSPEGAEMNGKVSKE
jgi:retinol dehydrogenase 12